MYINNVLFSEFQLQILAECEDYPILYDKTNPNHRNTLIKQKIWQQISDELKEDPKRCQDVLRYLKAKLKNPPPEADAHPSKIRDHNLLMEAGHYLISHSNEDDEEDDEAPQSKKIKRPDEQKPEEQNIIQNNRVQPEQQLQQRPATTTYNSNTQHTPNEMFLLSLLPSLDALSNLGQARVKGKIYNVIAAAFEQEQSSEIHLSIT